MKESIFLKYKKLFFEKPIYKSLVPATLNELQVLHFSANNKAYLKFGLLDSISNEINQIVIKAAFIENPLKEIKIIDKRLYSEIEFITDKKGVILWKGFYQVYAVSGETYSMPISGRIERK